jgi:hypothetical protein
MLHCSLVRTPKGVWVVNLPGRDVSVNGEMIQYALLHDGDELQVGDALFRVQYDSAPEPPAGPVSRTVREPETTSGPLAANELTLARSSTPSLPLRPHEAWRPPVPALATPDLPRPVPFEASLSWDDSASLPASPQAGGAELASLLARFAQQYAVMQQQMLEQFRQAMMMMGQMFGDMHRDQLMMVREEWERLHQVTQELHSLQLELARHSPSAPAPSPLATPPRNGARKAEPPQQPARVASPPKRAKPAVKGKDSTTKPAPSREPSRTPARAGEGSGVRNEPNRAGATTGDDFHVRLTQRIAALQVERQTLWEKITSYLKPQDSDSAQ